MSNPKLPVHNELLGDGATREARSGYHYPPRFYPVLKETLIIKYQYG